jgi:hypothetical protein
MNPGAEGFEQHIRDQAEGEQKRLAYNERKRQQRALKRELAKRNSGT